MERDAEVEDEEISRFLTAWFSVRQVIQAANFNHFQKAGLSATQFMTLNLLPVNDDAITIGELARRMNLKPATVAKTVDSLEARNMLTRAKSAADRRLVLVQITPKGRALQNAAVGQFREHMSDLFRAMPAQDRAALVSGLESIVRAANAPAVSDAGPVTPGNRAGPPAARSSRQSRRR